MSVDLNSKVSIVVTGTTTVEQAVDADINAFDEYFRKLGSNDPLMMVERAIIKTYLHFKIYGPRT